MIRNMIRLKQSLTSCYHNPHETAPANLPADRTQSAPAYPYHSPHHSHDKISYGAPQWSDTMHRPPVPPFHTMNPSTSPSHTDAYSYALSWGSCAETLRSAGTLSPKTFSQAKWWQCHKPSRCPRLQTLPKSATQYASPQTAPSSTDS